MDRAHLAEAIELLTHFAERTGLTSDRAPERYLWIAGNDFACVADATDNAVIDVREAYDDGA